MSDYFVDREILYTDRTRQICEDMPPYVTQFIVCLLYTSDAADEL